MSQDALLWAKLKAEVAGFENRLLKLNIHSPWNIN